MRENSISTNLFEKSVFDVEKSETQVFEDNPYLFSQSSNLTDVQLHNVNTEIDKNSQLKSLNHKIIFNKEPNEVHAANNDVLNESLLHNDYSSANNLKQHQFDLNNITIKPDPD